MQDKEPSCGICQKTYKRPPSARGKYCSRECYSESLKNKKEIFCLYCNDYFYPYNRQTKYCSDTCYFNNSSKENHHRFGESLSEEHKANLSKARISNNKVSGSNHWNWKGGITPENLFDINNGITLCKPCHIIVNFHEPEWENYFNFNITTWEKYV